MFLAGGVPDVFEWLLQLQWCLWKVLVCLPWFESVWIVLTKSSFSYLKWESIFMILCLQWWNDDLDYFYMMYRRCLKWKIITSTSELRVWKLWLKFAFYEFWKWFMEQTNFGLFFEGLKFQTISKWYLEHVRMTPLVGTCKNCNLGF